jgi:hypothetical protein
MISVVYDAGALVATDGTFATLPVDEHRNPRA